MNNHFIGRVYSEKDVVSFLKEIKNLESQQDFSLREQALLFYNNPNLSLHLVTGIVEEIYSETLLEFNKGTLNKDLYHYIISSCTLILSLIAEFKDFKKPEEDIFEKLSDDAFSMSTKGFSPTSDIKKTSKSVKRLTIKENLEELSFSSKESDVEGKLYMACIFKDFGYKEYIRSLSILLLQAEIKRERNNVTTEQFILGFYDCSLHDNVIFRINRLIGVLVYISNSTSFKDNNLLSFDKLELDLKLQILRY